MATYQEWNNAIIDYAIQGLSIGTRVFLSIDDETLETIGFMFGDRPEGGWSQDFINSVRGLCIHKDQVRLSRFTNPSLRDSKDRPKYVGFLAAMVLAAHYMGDTQEDKPVDPKDYFTHLNKLLGLFDKPGRTKGLDAGEDERLWQDWANWLRNQGFLPTARSGDGPYKYVRYPISQALLRQSDKNKLWRHFTSSNWHKNYDEVLLMQRIRRDAQYLTKHLQAILDPKGDMWLRSYDAISSACYEVYEEWREAGGGDIRSRSKGPRIRTSLEAKIYRSEDFFSGEVDYFIFPPQPKQLINAQLSVDYNGDSRVLEQERPGWYLPLWSLDIVQLNEGLKLPIHSLNSSIKDLYLPARDFWVLTLDPDTPESGIYASWDKGIELGTEFILLVKEQIQADLNRLRDEGLLEWQAMNPVFDRWCEYVGVTILSESEARSSLNLENETLRLTLQPHTSFSINLTGGLRAPRGGGWIIGHAPQISVAAFLPDAYLSVFDDLERVIFSTNIEVGKPIDVPFTQPGSYRIVVEQSGQSDEKLIRILNWEDISSRLMDFGQIAEELGVVIYGSLVRN
ncbi:MAG: hypothetical protein RLP44_23130 [Aggregatilineales bacterium]